MDAHVGSVSIPPASLFLAATLTLLAAIPAWERLALPVLRRAGRVPSPLTRIACALASVTAAMGCAAGVEVVRRRAAAAVAATGDDGSVGHLSIMWLTPQFVCIGVAEFFYVAAVEFFYVQAPPGLRSLAAAWLLAAFGVANLIAGGLVAAASHWGGWSPAAAPGAGETPPAGLAASAAHAWDATGARLDLYFGAMAAFSALNTTAFVVWVGPRFRERQEAAAAAAAEEEEEAEVEEDSGEEATTTTKADPPPALPQPAPHRPWAGGGSTVLVAAWSTDEDGLLARPPPPPPAGAASGAFAAAAGGGPFHPPRPLSRASSGAFSAAWTLGRASFASSDTGGGPGSACLPPGFAAVALPHGVGSGGWGGGGSGGGRSGGGSPTWPSLAAAGAPGGGGGWWWGRSARHHPPPGEPGGPRHASLGGDGTGRRPATVHGGGDALRALLQGRRPPLLPRPSLGAASGGSGAGTPRVRLAGPAPPQPPLRRPALARAASAPALEEEDLFYTRARLN